MGWSGYTLRRWLSYVDIWALTTLSQDTSPCTALRWEECAWWTQGIAESRRKEAREVTGEEGARLYRAIIWMKMGDEYLAEVSNLQPAGRMWPRMAVNVAWHKILNFRKTFCFVHQFSLVFVYLMGGPRQLFFQCGPETPKGWKPLTRAFTILFSTFICFHFFKVFFLKLLQVFLF